MLRATEILKACGPEASDEIVLDYDQRHRRRTAMESKNGTQFLLDLADVPDLRDGDGILLPSGTIVRVVAAPELLMEVRCRDPLQLTRIAWHLGNRHLPAEISDIHIRIRADHVIADMVRRHGASVRTLHAPFHPEGGAYATPEEPHAYGFGGYHA